jgi:Superinfection immunity protein
MGALIVLALYVVPTIVAVSRDMPNKGSTIAINLLLGWTVIGWVVALAMALGDSTSRGAHVVVQNNLVSGNMGSPMIAQPMQGQLPQPRSGVMWDHARQAYLFHDIVTRAWMIQSVDGTWLPLPQAAPQHSQLLPPSGLPLR